MTSIIAVAPATSMHDVLIHYLEVNFGDIAGQFADAEEGPAAGQNRRARSAERLRQLIRLLRRAQPAHRVEMAAQPPPEWNTAAEMTSALGADLSRAEQAVLDRFFALFARSMELRGESEAAPARPPAAPPVMPERELSPPGPQVSERPAAALPPGPARLVAEQSSGVLQTVLLAAAQQAMDLLQVDATHVYTVAPDGSFHFRAGVPTDSLMLPEDNGGPPDGLLGRALLENEVLAVEDLAQEALSPDEAGWVEAGYRGFAAIALAPPLERPVGVLALFRRTPWRMDRRDAVRLEELAVEAVGALRSNSLALKVEEVAILQERTKLAREIHDGLASDLAAVVALFKYYEQRRERDPEDAAQLLPQLRSMTEEILASARNILQSLRPKTIRSQGLMVSVLKMVDEFGRMQLLETNANLKGEENGLSPEQKEGIFQVLREALSNVRKHAQARSVWVTLDLSTSPWVMTVRDDGRGFDLDRIGQDPIKAGSYGLLGMRERAELLDASLQVETRPGAGTTVSLIGPLDSPS